MSSEPSQTPTYFSRCQHWLDSDPSLSVEGVEQTIEKFARQLSSEQGLDEAVKEDLQNTLDLLGNHLVELLGPDGESKVSVIVEDGASTPEHVRQPPASAPADDSQLDFSPLLPVDEEPLNLSDAEKQQRIQDLLASGAVTRGLAK
jgi:hypothetical protein